MWWDIIKANEEYLHQYIQYIFEQEELSYTYSCLQLKEYMDHKNIFKYHLNYHKKGSEETSISLT